MSMGIGNCPRCGRLYVPNPMGVCPVCIKELDMQYEKVLKYLRDNRGISIQELSEATEVPVRQIIKFIREGRISIMNNPNMGYPCESCGTFIRESNLCEGCRKKFSKEMQHASEDDRRREAKLEQDRRVGYNIKDRLNDRF